MCSRPFKVGDKVELIYPEPRQEDRMPLGLINYIGKVGVVKANDGIYLDVEFPRHCVRGIYSWRYKHASLNMDELEVIF